MRIAALYDVHGNLPALEAVLSELAALDVDRVIVGGDVIPGPFPCECLDRLAGMATPVEFILGNGETAVIQRLDGTEPAALPPAVRPLIEWTVTALRPDHQELIRCWPKTTQLSHTPLGRVLFCHATPRSETEIFTRLTAADRLRPVFTTVNAAVVVCGHTHMQFDRMIDNVRVVNAGSVGMPFAPPGAYWLLIQDENIQFRCTGYDFAGAAEQIRATSFPTAEQFAATNILNPPTEQQMLEVFSKAPELKP
jgi:predicted phosphodiesterase